MGECDESDGSKLVRGGIGGYRAVVAGALGFHLLLPGDIAAFASSSSGFPSQIRTSCFSFILRVYGGTYTGLGDGGRRFRRHLEVSVSLPPSARPMRPPPWHRRRRSRSLSRRRRRNPGEPRSPCRQRRRPGRSGLRPAFVVFS